MSFIAKLFLDNTERIVHNANVLFKQGVDFIGRPCTYPQGGLISLKVDRTHENLFFEWAVAPTMMKEGYIRFYKPDGMSKFTDLEFWDCYCVDYNEYFSHNTPEAMYIDLVLSPGVLRFRDIVFEKHWKVTDLSNISKTAINYNNVLIDTLNDEKKIKRFYFTDTGKNEINTFITGDTVYLNIESENLTGVKMDIKLDDKTHDFKYRGEILINDTLKGYQISGDIEQIELEVIDQQN